MYTTIIEMKRIEIIILVLLFVLITPGICFTLFKKSPLLLNAFIHALIFAIVYCFLNRFTSAPKHTNYYTSNISSNVYREGFGAAKAPPAAAKAPPAAAANKGPPAGSPAFGLINGTCFNIKSNFLGGNCVPGCNNWMAWTGSTYAQALAAYNSGNCVNPPIAPPSSQKPAETFNDLITYQVGQTMNWNGSNYIMNVYIGAGGFTPAHPYSIENSCWAKY